MMNVLVRIGRTPVWAALVIVFMFVGAARGQIDGYVATQPSPLNPTGPAVYDPRFDRFSTNFAKQTGNTESPLANPSASFIAAGQDLSGIGWLTSNPGYAFAMISPRDFITAAHNGAAVFTNGTSVSFFVGDANNPTTATATVAMSRQTDSKTNSVPPPPNPVSDILVGTLNADVPAGVTSYAIPIGTRSQFLGQQVFIYTQYHAIGTNNVSQFFDNVNLIGITPQTSTNMAAYDYNPNPGNSPGETIFQNGDSGKPTFMNVGGQFTLVGSHSAQDTVSGTQFSFDAFLPEYIAQINAAMALNGSPYSIRVVPVPEPTMTLTALVFGAGILTSWRRYRRMRAA